MALLITAADVLAVYDTDRDEDAVQPFMDAALALTDGRIAAGTLSDATLKEVQRQLAAHFMFVTDAGVHDNLRIDGVSETFTKSKQPGLLDSRWGRMAVALDYSGTLAALSRLTPSAQVRLI